MAYRLIYFSGAGEDDQANNKYIMRASDDGVNWGAEWITLDESPVFNALDPNLTQLSDGRLLLYYDMATRDPLVYKGIYFRLSSDGGLTWTDRKQIITSYGGDEAEAGPIIELADGRWCCPFYASGGYMNHSGVIFSGDDGETWTDEVTIGNGMADGRHYTETNLIEYSPGKILATIRVTVANQIWSCTSLDNGATWSAPALAFVGRSSNRMCLLSNGTIVTYLRDSPTEFPVLRTSKDNGATWSDTYRLLNSFPIYAHYGDIVELPDSRIGVAYTVGWVEFVDYSVHYRVLGFSDLP